MKKLIWNFAVLLLFFGCAHTPNPTIHKDIDISTLKDEIYYFPIKQQSNKEHFYQPLKRFDLIFTGYDYDKQNPKIKNLIALIPGRYTHVLMYIGKDDDGFAYAVELNVDRGQNILIHNNDIKLQGRLYYYCLGSDFGKKKCQKHKHIYGIDRYDFMLSKRLKYTLKPYKKQLLQEIQSDLNSKIGFKIPLDISLKTKDTKTITITDTDRKNGSSCAEYFVLLFEDVANICIKDTRIDAQELQSYYTSNPMGQKATVPIKHGIFFKKEVKIKELFEKYNYKLKNNKIKKCKCKNHTGIVTPDKLFHSPDLKDIDFIKL